MNDRRLVEEGRPESNTTGTVRVRPHAGFVYGDVQILLELLRDRTAEEERRRFVEGFRRLGTKATHIASIARLINY